MNNSYKDFTMATPSSSTSEPNSPLLQSSSPISSTTLPSPLSNVCGGIGASPLMSTLPLSSTSPSTITSQTTSGSERMGSVSLLTAGRDFGYEILSQNANEAIQQSQQHQILRGSNNFIINETISLSKTSSGATPTAIIFSSSDPNTPAYMVPFLSPDDHQQNQPNSHSSIQSTSEIHHIHQQQTQHGPNKQPRLSFIIDSATPLSLATISQIHSEAENRLQQQQLIADNSIISTTSAGAGAGVRKQGGVMNIIETLQPATSSSSYNPPLSPTLLSSTTTHEQDMFGSPSKLLDDCCSIITTTSAPQTSLSIQFSEMKQKPTTTTSLPPQQIHQSTSVIHQTSQQFPHQDHQDHQNLTSTTTTTMQSISSSTQTDLDISEMIIGKVTSLMQQQQQEHQHQQQSQLTPSTIAGKSKCSTTQKSTDNSSNSSFFYSPTETVLHKESDLLVPVDDTVNGSGVDGSLMSCVTGDVSISGSKSVPIPKSSANDNQTSKCDNATTSSTLLKSAPPTFTSVDLVATSSPSSSTSSSPNSHHKNPPATSTSTTILSSSGETTPKPVTAIASTSTAAAADTPSSHNNSDSVSSESIDIEIRDISLDENEGYQDNNTSSNSQQSAGGGGGGVNLSGNNNGTVGNGNGSSGNYISLLPPPVGSTGLASQYVGGGNVSGMGGNGTGTSGGGSGVNIEQTDFKYLFEELCPVCGDKVSGYHYGLLTCESCKGFFKRTVQNKKVYTCVAERQCHIDKTQRKRCPFCRFQKCLEVGMKLEAVRADRMRGGRNKFGPMYKRDRARKLQMMRQRQLALQAIRGSINTVDIKPGQLSPTGYQQSYPNMSIKQEIQIPQVSSLTQSPDSSPSPIAIALGQVNPNAAHTATSLGGAGSGLGSTNTTTVSGASGDSGGGGCGPGSETGSGASLQHSTDSKLWFVKTSPKTSQHSYSSKIFSFDTGTNPSSTADSVSTIEPLRVSPMIREFVQSVDDREWQTQLFTLLQKQSYNQVEVDLFELMCKVLDQNLFSQVDWARNTIFFKDLKVDDQMKLLQHSWSDMLVLDHLHQRIHNNLPDETQLHNGQIFNLLGLGLLGVPQLADYFEELQNKLLELKFDMGDYVCMKFLLLLNPDVRGIINRKTVLEGYENVQAALLDYTLTCYPSVTDKFSRLLGILPEIHALASRGEDHLYLKHCAGNAPTQTLLMEMLHAKRKL